MAQLPYDVLYKIDQHIAAPTLRDGEEGQGRFPFNHPALLPSTHARDLDASKNLRACALVCRAWSIPATTVNAQHLDIWRATAETVSTALARDHRHQLVQHFEAGREHCPACRRLRKPDVNSVHLPPCTAGVSVDTLLWTLSCCPNIRHLVVHEWLDLDSPTQEDRFLCRPFPNLTSFRVGDCDVAKRLRLRSFCLLLRLMPCLRRLAIGDLDGISESISDIPAPSFQLESLSVTDARGIHFRNYEWLLENSATSLRTLWVYGIHRPSCRASLLNAMRHVAPALRVLYYHASAEEKFSSLLQKCTALEELCVRDLTINRLPPLIIPAHPTLRKIVLAATAYFATLNRRGMVRFYDADEVQLLTAMLAEREYTFPRLQELAIETIPSAVVNAPVEELWALRKMCERKGVQLHFPILAELDLGHTPDDDS